MTPMTLPQVLRHNAETHGEKTWLIAPETGRAVTWVEAQEWGQRIARNLIAMGVKRGESVAIAAPNSIGSAMAFMGISIAGGRPTPINLQAGDKAIEYVLGHCEARFILAEESCRSAMEQAGSSAKIIALDAETGPQFEERELGDELPDIEPSEEGLLMYTSGTTGNPKGVLLSHHNLIAAGRNVMEAHALTADDIGLCILPLYHINGLCVTLIGSLVSAGGLVVPSKFSIKQFWQQLTDNRSSWFSAVPTIYSYILNDESEPRLDRERLRFARSASAPLPPEIHRQFEKRFNIPIIETMGLTETGAQILSNPLPPGERKLGSPGVAVGNEVNIVNPESFATLPPDTEGEIVIRGDNVMIGYLKQPEETAKTITQEGWFRSGDLGKIDQDGYVYVTGRIKELIIKGGENIAPREIDEVLLEFDGILEAAAFARPCPDYGQRVEACVSLKEGREFKDEDILEHCAKRLGAFKSPDRIHLLDDLPKGPSGKIQRLKLIELVPK